MHQKSLDISRKLKDQSGISSALCNIGIIKKKQGDLDAAESMYREALAIDSKLENLEGVAVVYGNLGNIMAERGQINGPEGAQAMLTKARDLFIELGNTQMSNKNQRLLDSLSANDDHQNK